MPSLRKHEKGAFPSPFCSAGLIGFKGAIPEKEDGTFHFAAASLAWASSVGHMLKEGCLSFWASPREGLATPMVLHHWGT